MNKGIIYYTHNRLDPYIATIVQQHILRSKLPIVSVSLTPIDFGKNIVLDLQPGYMTMIAQIIAALEAQTTTYVFFCEHDVLYPLSHFDFTPQKDDIFYYNAHVWRWDYPHDRVITYDRLISLSALVVHREFALAHYRTRLAKIHELHLEHDNRREPEWARKWGYEPGAKKIRRGGFSDDDFETFWSKDPIIDIRHGRTFSQSKVTLESFKHPPVNWRESTLDKMDGWNLRELFPHAKQI